ncbi:TniQ protein [Paenibacillus polysaccharolyticus]|uniref:TniQ protein n=1 Tax=Paenibacillus polysaccharolyticus TaxID=582692 RepID=A0A1G5AT83_9BACL|nr:TniQ family protein [Paenibacillus polysaccharolyticus]SCX81127.1 TniQ protein [Paenibacillus polysaccharolyticus]
MLLQFLPAVNADESFMSLALRMAKENGHQTLQTLINRGERWFDYRANLNYFKENTLWNQPLVDLLKEHGYSSLERHLLNQFDAVLFGGLSPTQRQFMQHYHQTKTKYCPRCLEEAWYHRLSWDVALFGVCLKHKVQLVEHCPCCSRVIRLDNLIGRGCNCGFGYADLINTEVPPPRVLSAQKTIQDVLHGKLSSVPIEGGHTLSPQQYFEGLHLFMKMLDNMPVQVLPCPDLNLDVQRLNYNLVKGEKMSNRMFTVLSTLAHELLTAPSMYFKEVVYQVELAKAAQRTKSTTRAKREIFDKLIGNEKFYVHRKLYLEVHNEHHNEFVRMLTATKEDERKYCSLLYARQKILHCDDIRLHQFKELGLLTFIEKRFGEKKITLVERAEVEALAQKRSQLLTTGEVGEQLGISLKMVVKLAQSKLLVMDHGPEKDGYGRRVFMPKAVEDFLVRLNTACSSVKDKTKKWMPLAQRDITALYYHASFSDVVQAVLSGRIQGAKTSPVVKSFEDVVISSSDLAHFYNLKSTSRKKGA